jgi:hypothetical protein
MREVCRRAGTFFSLDKAAVKQFLSKEFKYGKLKLCFGFILLLLGKCDL